jgi:dTDP-4-amino-4,6-dideoxygalactose transaminase
MQFPSDIVGNYSYCPILVGNEFPISRDSLYEKLKSHKIFSRRYFYPLISNFPMYKNLKSSKKSNLPIANMVANQILCLPIYPQLSSVDIVRITEIIKTIR